MRRRDLIILLAGRLRCRRCRAQQKAMPVIGFLSTGSLDTVWTLDHRFLPRTEGSGLCRGTECSDRTPLGGGAL